METVRIFTNRIHKGGGGRNYENSLKFQRTFQIIDYFLPLRLFVNFSILLLKMGKKILFFVSDGHAQNDYREEFGN